MTVLIPVTGSTNVVHAVERDSEPATLFGSPQTTLCKRRVKVSGTYEASAWSGMVAEWFRIGRTHQTFVCGACAKRSREDDEGTQFWLDNGHHAQDGCSTETPSYARPVPWKRAHATIIETPEETPA